MFSTLPDLTDVAAEKFAWQCIQSAKMLLQEPQDDKRFLSIKVDQSDGVDSFTIVYKQKPDEYTFLWLDERDQWCRSKELPADINALFDLYLPVLGTRADVHRARVVAHLGQSIDGQIATTSGDSFFVTGEENRKHLHCLRALSDAVVVGSGTILADDPQLTTRAVTGEHPVRVIIDSQARLPTSLGVFTDAQSSTVLVHQSSADLSSLEMSFGPQITDKTGCKVSQVNRWVVPDTDESLCVNKMVEHLFSRDLRRVFVEGGGITVSRFFEAKSLDRLHLAVAPILVGQGTPALQLPGIAKMMQAHRPPHTIFRMGDDILWDFDVSGMKNDGRANEDTSGKRMENTSNAFVQRIL